MRVAIVLACLTACAYEPHAVTAGDDGPAVDAAPAADASPDVATASCPGNYTFEFGGHHYRALADFGEVGDFNHVRGECSDDGYHLITIDSAGENDFVEQQLEAMSFSRVELWVGLSGNNGTYQWIDGTPLGYQNWDTNAGTSDCVALHSRDGGGRWFTHVCGGTLSSVRPAACECP